jgi:hypothetical protein
VRRNVLEQPDAVSEQQGDEVDLELVDETRGDACSFVALRSYDRTATAESSV